MLKALFICSQNKLRSPTAEQVFAAWPDVETDSAGLNNDAETPLTVEQIAWADIILVMEKQHFNRLRAKFKAHLGAKRIICLNIPDEFGFMEPALIRLLEARAGRYLAR